MGLEDARLEPYEFGEGWSFTRCELRLVSPAAGALAACPRPGPADAGTVRAPCARQARQARRDRSLAGKWRARSCSSRRTNAHDAQKPMFERYTPDELRELEEFDVPPAATPTPGASGGASERRCGGASTSCCGRRSGGVIERSSSSTARSAWEAAAPWGTRGSGGVPSLVVSAEAYDRVARLLADGETVELELTVDATYHRGDTRRGHAGRSARARSARRVVMAGAHLDSWHAERAHRQRRGGASSWRPRAS